MVRRLRFTREYFWALGFRPALDEFISKNSGNTKEVVAGFGLQFRRYKGVHHPLRIVSLHDEQDIFTTTTRQMGRRSRHSVIHTSYSIHDMTMLRPVFCDANFGREHDHWYIALHTRYWIWRMSFRVHAQRGGQTWYQSDGVPAVFVFDGEGDAIILFL
jgi:hypothetical protein